jgi:hypothetical protein
MEGARDSFAPAILVLQYNTFSTNIDNARFTIDVTATKL